MSDVDTTTAAGETAEKMKRPAANTSDLAALCERAIDIAGDIDIYQKDVSARPLLPPPGPIGHTLDFLRDLKDLCEAANAIHAMAYNAAKACEARIIEHCEQQGVSKVEGERLSVSLVEKMRARYEPEHWEGIVAWAVENGVADVVQRRLSDKKVEALVMEGRPLPVGLRMESYKDVATRRK